MAIVDRAFLVERIVSLASAPLICLVLLTHLLPSRLTLLPAKARIRAPSVSLLICVLVRALLVVLDQQTQVAIVSSGTISDSLCVADAALEAFWAAALAAHIPLIIHTLNAGHPTIEHPNPHPRHTPLLLCFAWAYPLLPAVPLLASLVVRSGSDGKWWGYYCHSTVWWWRPLRTASLLAPLLLSLILLIPLAATLYSLSGNPTPEIRSTRRQWGAAVYLLIIVCASIAYLVLEQAIGWSAEWWPRAAEAAPAPLALLAYGSHPDIWRVWFTWLRLRRPPDTSLGEETGQPVSPNSTISGKGSSKSKRQPHQRTSSFWSAPPAEIYLSQKEPAAALRPPLAPIPIQDRSAAFLTKEDPIKLAAMKAALAPPAEVKRHITSIPPPPPVFTAAAPRPPPFSHRPLPSQDEARSPPFTYSLALSNETFGSGLDVLPPPAAQKSTLDLSARLDSGVRRLSGGTGSLISELSKYSDTTSVVPPSQPPATGPPAPSRDRETTLTISPSSPTQKTLLPPARIYSPRVDSPSVVGSDRSLVSGGTFGTRTPGHPPRQPPPFGYASRLKYGEDGYRERSRLSKQRNVTWENI